MNACKQRVYKTTSNQNLGVDAELARVKSEAFNYLNTHPKNYVFEHQQAARLQNNLKSKPWRRRRACSREKRSF
ncbi:hypothetical protein AOR04_04385 [Pseudoalteromonas sp. 1_2015MBL_MicDiv]|nr:hypothetical protein AOR04_04385 [Pseudoalteromonas sp. 1_2015MBL_MicDiv]